MFRGHVMVWVMSWGSDSRCFTPLKWLSIEKWWFWFKERCGRQTNNWIRGSVMKITTQSLIWTKNSRQEDNLMSCMSSEFIIIFLAGTTAMEVMCAPQQTLIYMGYQSWVLFADPPQNMYWSCSLIYLWSPKSWVFLTPIIFTRWIFLLFRWSGCKIVIFKPDGEPKQVINKPST